MKRSLHIGINDYPGTGSDLSGCINDAHDWGETLESYGFQTTTLIDGEAKKADMVEAISKIVSDTSKDDIAVITYSGHGTWVPDEDDDEADGRDEALCPYDIAEGNVLTDDEMYEIFSERTRGARIIFISDSCHSGTLSRASNIMLGNREELLKMPKTRFLAPELYIRGDQTLLNRARSVEKRGVSGKTRSSSLFLCGCKDTEYSYDAWFDERANGAFTYAALKALKELPVDVTYRDWFKEIRKLLPHENYPQTPQISGSSYQRNNWKVFSE